MEKAISNNDFNKNSNIKSLLKFIILSAIGVFLFMTPISNNGQVVIPIARLSSYLQDTLSHEINYIIMFIVTITTLMSLITKIFKPSFIMNNSFLHNLFDVNYIWLAIRSLGCIFVFCTFFKVGPEAIWSPDTGGMVMSDLLPVLFSVFLFAGLFLPLLLSFGLLEFVGALLIKIMRPLFNLPGASAIDCITSWLGDGTIGVLLTSRQYENGYYSEREACVIGTTFSLVSITFSIVVIDTVGLSHLFVPFYGIVCFASFIAAIIVPKLPPLSKKKDTYYNDINKAEDENSNNSSLIKTGFNKALDRASASSFSEEIIKKGTLNVLDMWLGVIPVVMGVGTIALMIAEYTPVFHILGLPFIPILKVLQVPEAAAASGTLIAGFADMLLPSIIASGIENEMTRFIIAATSVTQLIYLSEVGALLLGSKIPIKFGELFIIFLERTLITLPVISLLAHIVF